LPLTLLHRRRDWAEDEEEETIIALPQPQITKNKDGSETIVSYRFDEQGKKLKTTRRIRKTVIKTIVNPRVAERKQWAKFGEEKGKPVGPQTDTTSIAENIVFRPQVNWKANQQQESNPIEQKKASLKDTKIKCRICSGEHWTSKCPFKDTMAPEGELGPTAGLGEEDAGGSAGGLGGGVGGSYVPPHLRGKAGVTGERMGGGKYQDRDDLATLRVTNVSEYAEEQDLRDMFSRFGHVTRVFLAKDRETGRAKGFAFVSFADRTDAASACEKMDGCEYLHRLALDCSANVLHSRLQQLDSPRRVCEEVYIVGSRLSFSTLLIMYQSPDSPRKKTNRYWQRKAAKSSGR
jgi:translation initiation factor 3 subunit G